MRLKLLDGRGNPVPESEYDLVLGEEDFVFKLKKPDRSKSGKYRVVVSNDAGDAEKEVDVDFAGKDGNTRVGSILNPRYGDSILRKRTRFICLLDLIPRF